MPRLSPIQPESLTPEQKQLYDQVMSTRPNGLAGPFGVWVRKPSVGEPCERLQNAFRLHGALDRRVAELLILMVAREWTAQYAWYLHEKLGLKAGLTADTIAAIRARERPPTLQPNEGLVYDLVRELLETKTISTATYDRSLQHLGEGLLIEVVSAVGFYSMVCMTLNAFDVPIPEGAPALP
jgi:4-carboxymuconolactone decarboxylase